MLLLDPELFGRRRLRLLRKEGGDLPERKEDEGPREGTTSERPRQRAKSRRQSTGKGMMECMRCGGERRREEKRELSSLTFGGRERGEDAELRDQSASDPCSPSNHPKLKRKLFLGMQHLYLR